MCLLLISYRNHPKYKLIIAANRDEFFRRPTTPAHFWPEHQNLLAGKDIEAGGTWLGLTTSGNFSAITNYRDIRNLKSNAPTRGKLITDFLLNNYSISDFAKELKEKADLYNGYNLIFGNLNSLNYFSNHTKTFRELNPGIYGLSNHLLDTPWYKVEKSKKLFSEILAKKNPLTEELFEILSDKSFSPDDLLPDTGLEKRVESAISAIFVSTPEYGTRASTIILVNHQNYATFIEKSLNYESGKWIKSSFEFEILE